MLFIENFVTVTFLEAISLILEAHYTLCFFNIINQKHQVGVFVALNLPKQKNFVYSF